MRHACERTKRPKVKQHFAALIVKCCQKGAHRAEAIQKPDRPTACSTIIMF